MNDDGDNNDRDDNADHDNDDGDNDSDDDANDLMMERFEAARSAAEESSIYIYIQRYRYTSEHLLVYTNSTTAHVSLKSCRNPVNHIR